LGFQETLLDGRQELRKSDLRSLFAKQDRRFGNPGFIEL
jgi:hypothetical protein